MTDHLFGITDPGKIRDNNEDLFIAEEVMKGQFIVAAVIDGVGGYEGGEIAAALTKDVLLNEVTVIGNDVTAQLELAFNLANEEIIARKLEDQQLSNMACVATVAIVDPENNLLHYTHVGDTRLYLFRDHSLVQLSHDQSFVGFLEESGRLTEEEAMQHPKRNEVNQALGLGSIDETAGHYFERGSSPFLPGDMILICSDGLTDLVKKEGISKVLDSSATLKLMGEKLVDLANAAGGKDNITIVLVRNDKKPVKHDVARPVADLFSPVPPEAELVKENKSAALPVEKPELPTPAHNYQLPNAAAANKETNVGKPAGTADPENHYRGGTLKNKSSQGTIVTLSVLCLLFLAVALWLFFTSPPTTLKSSGSANAPVAATLGAQEKLISDSLSKLKGDTLTLNSTVFAAPVQLSKALQINRDTLIIKTDSKVVFKADSAYKGPALILSSNCKYVVIDGLVLKGFATGIVSYKNQVELKNVRFEHCAQSLQVLFTFPDQNFVNGRVTKRPFLADSLITK